MVELRHFTLSEFDSPDSPGSGFMMKPKFLQMLDDARHTSGIRFRINSGFRTPKHNRSVGGRKHSSHLNGWAADISCKTSTMRYKLIIHLQAAGFTRMGIGRSFIHVDCDPDKKPHVIWVY